MEEQEVKAISSKQANRRLVIRLLGIVVGMFAFGFALVPLYDVFCDITGINGRTRGQALYQVTEVDQSRLVTVEFITSVHSGLQWDFEPRVKSIEVHPGELNEVLFYAKNRSKNALVGQAVPSVSPGEVAIYFNKTECFCFDQQRLASGEEIEMPMKFFIDKALPRDVNRITLSYQVFKVAAEAESLAKIAK